MTSLMRGGVGQMSDEWVTFFLTWNSLSCEWLWVTIIIEWLFWQRLLSDIMSDFSWVTIIEWHYWAHFLKQFYEWLLLSDIIEHIFWGNFMSDYYWVILLSTFSEAMLWVTIIEWFRHTLWVTFYFGRDDALIIGNFDWNALMNKTWFLILFCFT